MNASVMLWYARRDLAQWCGDMSILTNFCRCTNLLPQVQCSLRQMLENGFFHADPHAGNLLALPDGKLCYLDFGMVRLPLFITFSYGKYDE